LISNALTRKDALSPVCYIIHEEPRTENQHEAPPEPPAENQDVAHGEQPRAENQHVDIRESSSKIKEKKMYPPDGEFASGGDGKGGLSPEERPSGLFNR
jgi:hypothetical protein